MLYPTPTTLSAVFPSPVQREQKQKRGSGGAEKLFHIASMSDEEHALSQNAQAKASKAAQNTTGKIELYSAKYYAACTFGGLLACGTTHTSVTPLDLIKCRHQVSPTLYSSNLTGFQTIVRTTGIRGLFTGWSPTFFGYSAQGAFKYGGYEFFKKQYSDRFGTDAAQKYKTLIYLSASASAEFLADVALCPFEAVKVRMQTAPTDKPVPYSGKTFAAIKDVSIAKLYVGIGPLWGRQIPYTMMKFASFETIVEMIYDRLPHQKSEYGRGAQTAVSFTAGYLAGVLCAVVSHPADVMVSKLNNTDRSKGEGAGSAMKRIYGDIGFRGLWSGLPVRIVMIGTLTGLQWLIYDSFKIFVGLPTTGGSGGRK